jgi:aspartate kinase
METFGAKILHPSSLMPAIRQQIPVFVGSTFEPDEAGTTITPDVELRPVVRAVTSRSRQLLVVINNPDMLTASGFLQRIFAVFDQFEISVDAITTSEISIAVTIDHSEYPEGARGEQFLAALREHGAVKLEKNMALIAIVGNDLHQTPGIGARIFNALDNINVRMITQGASSHNFCLIVSEEDAARAVKQLHDQLID